MTSTDGLRVGKSVNASLTRYLYEYDKVILELNALGNQTGRNVYGLNLISRTFGEDTFFYFYNGHADVTALLAADGTIAATYYYDAFGNILDQTGTVTSNILYAGYQYDPETGLYYLNARMYDPVTARFIQEDTYTGKRNDALSLNLYTYCHNEPMMYSDPTGHREVEGTEVGGHTTHSTSIINIAKKYLKARSDAYSFVSTQYSASVANINVGISGRIDSFFTSTGIGKENVAANYLATQAKMNIGMLEGAFQWGIEGVEAVAKSLDPLTSVASMLNAKDKSDQFLKSKEVQTFNQKMQSNPGNFLQNAWELSYSTNMNTLQSISTTATAMYNQLKTDPFYRGQVTMKISLDIATLFVGVGEVGAASDAAKVATTAERGAEAAASVTKTESAIINSVDDVTAASRASIPSYESPLLSTVDDVARINAPVPETPPIPEIGGVEVEGYNNSILNEASQSAFKAADNVSEFSVSNKHLMDAGGRWQKFDTTDKGQVNTWVQEGLRSENAQILPNNQENSYKIITDLGKTIGTRGETKIQVIIGADGKIWTAYPVK